MRKGCGVQSTCMNIIVHNEGDCGEALTVYELPSERPTDSLLEQIPVPAQNTATFRSSSDCFHTDTNKGTHLTFLSQAWGESKAPCVC